MRIKMNGPDEFEYFAAAKYAWNWIKKHLPTDSKIGAKNENSKQSEILLDPENAEAKKKYLLKSTIF